MDEAEKQRDSLKSVVFFSFEAVQPIPLGDSFIKEGLDLKLGGELSYNVYLFDKVLVGAGYNWFKGRVINKQVTGNYDRTNVSVIFGTTGYRFFPLKNVELLFTFGLGYVRYMNRIDDLDAYDDGTSYWLSPKVSYQFIKNFSVYTLIDFRRDKLDIQVPNALDDFYNKIYYANVSLGINYLIY